MGGRGGPGSTTSGSTVGSSYNNMMSYSNNASTGDGQCRLLVSASSLVNQAQMWKLFDLVPGVIGKISNLNHFQFLPLFTLSVQLFLVYTLVLNQLNKEIISSF
jgi:hypothetical protein